MKTLLILNDLESDLEYLLVKGDYSKFHGVCVNTANSEIELEFCEFVWDEDGQRNHKWSTDVALLQNKEWDKVAICTVVP